MLQARNAQRAVIFRRGPSKQVLLLAWNTKSDQIEEGQWLKGHIYERRCDLSPDGRLLIYFAANWKKPYRSWTAVSRPPFLTALALWPKGDAYGGGGLFASKNEILLNHRARQRMLAPDFSLPKTMRVSPLGEHAGYGEDDPIGAIRLQRDGWTLADRGSEVQHPYGSPVWFEYDPPITWTKPNPTRPRLVLRMTIHGIKERGGAWYVTQHAVLDPDRNTTLDLGRSEWADWDHDGDLLFAIGGRLLRLRAGGTLDEAKTIVDLTDRKFIARAPDASAVRWPR